MAYEPYIRGQIVKVRLRNFMSYNEIELRPGFHLNLIIGPNGTGKSTFVCAVILGLGGNTKSLGRADRLSAYVRNGSDECDIDIELYEPEDDNVVVSRKIYLNNHSEFYINGRQVTAGKINEVKAKYNIQVDNLCTFLPQERVQDFSKLNPQQLLDQTQNTIGNEVLISVFERLRNLQKTAQEKESQFGSLEGKIEEERLKNDRLKDKVDSFLEKQALMEKVDLIKQKKAWLCYHDQMLKVKEIAKDLKLAQDKHGEKKEELHRILKDLEQMENDVKKVENGYSRSKRDWEVKRTMLEDEMKRLRQRVEILEDLDRIVQSKLAAEENKKQEVVQYQETLDKLKNDLSFFESKNGKNDDLVAREEKMVRELMNYHREESKLSERRSNIEDNLEKLTQEMKQISIENRLLGQKKNFRLDYLKRREPDAYKSVEWLKEHRNLFQGHIYNPLLLEMDVTEPRFAKYVEARIAYRDLISFTCTNPDDLNLLIKKLRTEQKLKINVICSEDDDLAQHKPDIPLNQIRPFGFFTYMNDIMTGPSHILHYLCKTYKIHCIPIGDNTVKIHCEQVPNRIPIFFSENEMFNLKVSAYSGDRALNVKPLNESKLFHVPNVNRRVEKLQNREKELQFLIENKQKEIKEIAEEFKSVQEKIETITRNKRDLATLREEKKQIILKIKRVEHNIQSLKGSIKDPSEILEEADNERKNLRKEISRILSSMKERSENLEKCTTVKHEHAISHKIIRLKMNSLEQNKMICSEKLIKLEDTLDNIKRLKEEKESCAMELKEAAKKLTNGLSPGQNGFDEFEKKFQTLKSTVEELETEIQEINVMAEFLHGGSAQVLQEYQQREEKIARLMNEQQEWKKSVDKVKAEIETLRDKWLDPIRKMVDEINAAFGSFFESMGCAGEVSLVSGEKPDEFDKYGIVIKVKFRNETPLQQLGRHFQSGGERAVATAVYLLSLQRLMVVPFRFVDEINQGMDVTNEQRIMDLMVNVTTNRYTGQYFFITPKILPTVNCPDTIVVHCIYSAKRIITSKDWDLPKFLTPHDR